MRYANLIFGGFVFCLSGCSLFYPSQASPVIEDKVGDHVGTLAVTGQRRLTLVNLKDGKFCSEPPPDAVDNLSGSLSASLSASGIADKEAAGQVASSFASVAKQMFYRSQGIQLYRDGMFRYCNDYLNGVKTAEQLNKDQAALLELAVKLIVMEIPYIQNVKSDTVPAAKSPEPEDSKSKVIDSTPPT